MSPTSIRPPAPRRLGPILGGLLGVVGALICALIQTSVLPYFKILSVQPTLPLAMAVIFAAQQAGTRALFWGFGIGLAVDLFSALPLGTNALIFTLMAFGAGAVGRWLNRTTILAPITTVALATIAYVPAVLVVRQLTGYRTLWSSQLATLPSLVLVNAIAALALYPVVSRFDRWTRPAPGPTFRSAK